MKKYLVAAIIVSFFLSGCITPPSTDSTPAERIPIEEILIDKANASVQEEPAAQEAAEEETIEPSLIKTESTEEVFKIITVEETELVNFNVQVEDPDSDRLQITYSDPLDAQGKWQTTYGNAREYPLTISVSDNESTTSKKVLLIVTKKEEPPVITEFEPKASSIAMKENEEASFAVRAEDVNQDTLSFTWLLDGAEVTGEQTFSFAPSFDDAGSHEVLVKVSDGASSVENLWEVSVSNVNRAPVLEELPDRTVRENELVELSYDASDPDGDALTPTVSAPLEQGSWQTGYNDAGTYTIAITVSDGDLEASRSFVLTVENVNRPPVITDIIQQ